ncbi:hypothetical protein B1C78_00275 [Thioalkalivibrio denitrificans]|uniref:DNA 3'-5' helicase n=1 Tax=Thioalkalivibrio denitrificans TaxID=108003 RepID=A0A1V3NVR7_9GAMM|nr:ATP-dependent helicase [Thioalkalivibrio denitrificans]OOG28816.1 hypothetical protein B1C78_00275 [Thioalkalivibrio denitrificans]
MSWNDGLDTESPAYAVAATQSPHVRVVAGPGAGKSFAMKRRVARLLEEGIEPERILPVTFTRVAAEDLHRELVGMQVDGCDKLQGTTLHSLALRILMRNHVLVATGRTPRPLNDFEMKPLEADLGTYGGLREVRKLVKAYEAAWARLQHEEPGYTQSPLDQAFSTDLVDWLIFHNAMLIGEVIPQLYQYLRSNPGVDERSEFSHILVDEYQDLNRAEQSSIELLSDVADVCIVGDDDQSIYSFKHAHPEGIRDWIENKEEAEDLTLVECRRCPTRVVDMANSLISHNQLRPLPRELEPRAENGEGHVEIIQFANLDEEVNGVASRISDLIAEGADPGEILVLAQRGVIGTPIYEKLVAEEIPVRSYYAEAELDSDDAQRRFALLKLYVERDDRVALRWLLGLGSANWRTRSYRRIRDHCAQTGDAPWQVLSELSEGSLYLPHTSAVVSRFDSIRAEIEGLEQCGGLSEVVDALFPDDDESVRDLRQTSLNVLEELEGEEPVDFLRELVSAIAAPEIPTEIEDVRIMSLHKSKGLSAPITIIAGCVEGLLPMRPASDLSPDARAAYLEEQRRLFFVGISRVKAAPLEGKPGTLLLTYSRQMPMATAMSAGISPASGQYGVANLNASRFIAELGAYAPAPVAG